MVAKKKAQLAESFKRLETIPAFLSAKEAMEIMSVCTLQLGSMGDNLLYISNGGPGSDFLTPNNPAFLKAKEFKQSVNNLLTESKSKKWNLAVEDYNNAVQQLAEWKALVNF